MRVGELDLKARTWTIPASRSKNKHAHTLPLSDMAVEIIEKAIADAGGSRFLFPTGDGTVPLSAKNAGKAIIRARGRIRNCAMVTARPTPNCAQQHGCARCAAAHHRTRC